MSEQTPSPAANATDRWTQIGLVLSIVLFLAGAGFHANDLIQRGWLPYTFAPDWMNLFWSCLIGANLVAALLLALRLRFGIIVAIAVMAASVAVNTYAHNLQGETTIFWGYIIQMIFLGFLIGFVRPYWRISR